MLKPMGLKPNCFSIIDFIFTALWLILLQYPNHSLFYSFLFITAKSRSSLKYYLFILNLRPQSLEHKSYLVFLLNQLNQTEPWSKLPCLSLTLMQGIIKVTQLVLVMVVGTNSVLQANYLFATEPDLPCAKHLQLGFKFEMEFEPDHLVPVLLALRMLTQPLVKPFLFHPASLLRRQRLRRKQLHLR